MKERERDREREKVKERKKERERKRERETDRQTDRERQRLYVFNNFLLLRQKSNKDSYQKKKKQHSNLNWIPLVSVRITL